MKIYYSIHYDAGAYLGDRHQMLGEAYLGNMGLLSQLEMRAGCASLPMSDMEREAEYLNALKPCIGGTLFANAFKVDELGVARKLLGWRDGLMMAGWDMQMFDGISPKLQVLAEAEKRFVCPGNADRWRKVKEAYEALTCVEQIDEVVVACSWIEVPTLVQQTLERLATLGVTLTKQAEPEDAKIDLCRVKIVAFHQLIEAYEWFATSELPEGTVVVNRDNVLLNHVLFTWDKPLTQATLRESNPQLLQLFKLGVSIFSRPINMQNLLSYLLLPKSPIPKGLRRQLAQLLLEAGGFGETDASGKDKWTQIIDNHVFENKDGVATPQAKAKKMPFLEPIRKDYSQGIPKADLLAFVDALRQWIRGHFADDTMGDDVMAQYRELLGQLAAFDTALKGMGSFLQSKDVEQLVQRLYRPMNYTCTRAEVMSAQVVSDVRALAATPKRLLWLDCQEADVEGNAYDFLSDSETTALRAIGVAVPDHGKHLRVARLERMAAMQGVEEIVLVASAYHGTSRLCEHPIIAEVTTLYKQAHNGEPMPLTDKDTVFAHQTLTIHTGNVETFAPQAYYDLEGIQWQGRTESNHSIDTLINYPFDYVVNYIARLWEPQDNQLHNTHITQGLVAHHFFEHIICDSMNGAGTMRHLLNNGFDQRLESAIDATGLSLRLPENASMLDAFRPQVKESMGALIDIIEKEGLTPVGCEIVLPQSGGTLSLPAIGDFGARIDFLLTDENGDYVIFDFKWSHSKKYATMLEKNLSIQLELYRQTVEAAYPGKKVAGVGYFLMPRQQLVTTDFQEIPGSQLIKQLNPVTTNLKEQIQRSFEFRMKEIQCGHIEEGEMQDLKDYVDGYVAKTGDLNLCPIAEVQTSGRGDGKVVVAATKPSQLIYKSTKKATFEEKSPEPAEVATTHPILKGRLK